MPELWRLSSSQDVERKLKPAKRSDSSISSKQLRIFSGSDQSTVLTYCSAPLISHPVIQGNPSLCRLICRYREHGYRGGEGADRARSPAPTHHPPQPLFYTSRYDTPTTNTTANLLLFTNQLSWLVPSLPGTPVPALSLCSDRTLLLTMLLRGTVGLLSCSGCSAF